MEDAKNKIYVSHINIRQSIFLLLFKLLGVEFIAAFLVIVLHTILYIVSEHQGTGVFVSLWFFPLFFTFVGTKSFVTFYIILRWFHEYYEIFSSYIYHKWGIFIKKEEKYPISQIAYTEVSQGIIGSFFNFGTIILLNPRRYQLLNMYLIHNPLRFARIIKDLLPNISEKNELFRTNLIQEDDI